MNVDVVSYILMGLFLGLHMQETYSQTPWTSECQDSSAASSSREMIHSKQVGSSIVGYSKPNFHIEMLI